MLKVMLIDDEPFILQGLQILIDWKAEGYEIVALMSNGKEAYEYLKENKVDLIISDIQMPVMTGLELLEKIRTEKISSARFAILTGYDDIAYAQRAIRNESMDYILKPVQKEDILALLRNVSERETEKAVNKAEQRKMEDAYLASNLLALIKGKFDSENLEYVRNHLQLSGDIRFVDIEVLGGSRDEENDDFDLRMLQHQLHHACCESLKENANHFIFDVSYDNQNYDVGFIYCENMATRNDLSEKEFFKDLIKKIENILFMQIKMTCGKKVSDISAIAKSYSSCCMLIGISGFHKRKKLYIYEEDVQVDNGQNIVLLCKNSIDNVISAINDGDKAAIDSSIDHLFEELREIDEKENAKNLNINYLLFQLIHIATKQDDNVNQEEVIHYISENSFDESIIRGGSQHMKRFAYEYSEYLFSLRKNVSRGLIFSIENEINEHYAENITLKSLGDKYYINSSYLGQLFRKTHNISFKDYLTKVRVSQAAYQLLNTDKKINKIAEDVGYYDCDYFIRKFIELKGCTPSKYRRDNKIR